MVNILKYNKNWKTILSILLQNIQNKGITEKECLKMCSINTSFLTDWKSDKIKNPSIDKVVKLANFLNLDLNELLLGINNPSHSLTEDENSLLAIYNKLSSSDKTRVSERAETLAELAAERAMEQKKEHRTERIHAAQKCLPLNDTCEIRYYDRAASAGTGLFLDEAIAETLTVQNTPEAQQADYAIPVSGDSMEEEYHDGDIVLVKSCPCVRKGEVGIFLLDGSVYIKEYGEKCLISYNEDYPPIDLSKYETAACLGKVIGIANVNP